MSTYQPCNHHEKSSRDGAAVVDSRLKRFESCNPLVSSHHQTASTSRRLLGVPYLPMLSQYQDWVPDGWIEHCRVEKRNSNIQRFRLRIVLMVQISGPRMEYGKEHGVCSSA